MRLKGVYLLVGLLFPAGLAAVGFSAYAYGSSRTTADWVRDMRLPRYGKQQVIYHVDQGAGLFNSRYRHILQEAQNHVDAVGADRLDLRIILQGDGLDMLIWAKGNANADRQIDRLKAEGVKFEVCRNTLLARRLDPDKDLYGVKREDVIRAAVGEIAALEQQGFQYIKP